MEQELTQEGTVQEETSGTVSTEEKPTSEEPRTYTDEEWKTFQSKADKQIYETSLRATEAEHRLKDLEEDHNLSVKQFQELQQELDRKEEQGAEGDSETLSAIKLRRDTRKAKLEVEKKEKALARREQEMASLYREQYAYDLAKHYGVEVKELINTESPEAMEVKALKLERERLQKGQAPKPQYDKGISDAGGGRTSFTREGIAKMSYQEYKENAKAIDKAFKAGRIK